MDHYQTLGVPKTASAAEIKQAYRKLASIHHPDKKGGDTATFQKIQVAYDTLGDPDKRAAYDRPQPQFHRGPGGFSFSSGDNIDLHELFRRMHQHNGGFGESFHRTVPMYRTLVGISLDDVYHGGGRVLTIKTETGDKILNITIPKGIHNGNHIKYENVIEDGTLIVEFRVEPHLKFERRGNDLYSSFPISVLDLIVGATIDFTTLSGKTLSVNIPAGTQPHMQLKMSGQGLPIPGTSSYGDQILLIKPFVPDSIPKEVTESILRAKTS